MSIQGPSREFIDATEQSTLANTLVLTERRRPLYFDGRFLKAIDLTREQTYFLSRQAALSRTSGFGVVQGLEVLPVEAGGLNAFQVTITPGCGVTPGGEVVTIARPLTVDLGNLALIQQLDATFGLAPIADDPIRALTGLFILGLRLVEYTRGRVASYPTSITSPRSLGSHDSDIIEATAVSLIRYGDLEGDRARAQAAHDIFVKEVIPPLPTNLLPLAMLALDQGSLGWIDRYLVRRDLSTVTGATVGLSTTPRSLRVAHLQQYNQQLQSIPDSGNFAAASYFAALPAAGRLPKGGINATDFTQTFFPADVAVELSVAPTDEIAALLEDSLNLPPIDLLAESEALASLSVLAIIPMTRQRLQSFKLALSQATNAPLPSLPIRPLPLAAPGLIAKRSPLEVLRRLKIERIPPIIIPPRITADTLWRQALNQADRLWYVRRRQVAYAPEIVGTSITLGGNDRRIERELTDRLETLNLTERFNDLQGTASITARADMVSLLAAPQINRSDLLLRSVVRELETIPPAPTTPEAPGTEPTPETTTLDRPTVFRVAERFGDPRLGEGLSRLEASDPALTAETSVADTLAASGAVVELDRVARTLPARELTAFSRELTTVARRGDATAVNTLIRNRLEGVR
jgi:hypothetical protein